MLDSASAIEEPMRVRTGRSAWRKVDDEDGGDICFFFLIRKSVKYFTRYTNL